MSFFSFLSKPNFKNESKRIDPKQCYWGQNNQHCYAYDAPSRYMKMWSSLFQSVVSQSVTYLITGKFHDTHTGIFKAEGGANVPGHGDLVLGERRAYWDYSRLNQEYLKEIHELITNIVLEWNPNDPIESMLDIAAKEVKCEKEELRGAVEKTSQIFNGDSLWTFFNPNKRWEEENFDDYERYCLVNFNNFTNEEVDQRFADRILAKELKIELKKALQPFDYYLYSCSPERQKGGALKFWINTGRMTNIDCWQTEESIRAFIKAGKAPEVTK